MGHEPGSFGVGEAGVRLLWVAVLLAALYLYVPINRTATGGVSLALPLDDYITLAPLWVIPYLGGLAAFLVVLLAAYRFMPGDLFRGLVVSYLIASAVGYTIYLLYPTYVNRPPLASTEGLARWVDFVYSSDRAYNAFPSGHTYGTVIAWLYLWHWQPRLRSLTTILAVLVVLSTVFTKQHVVLDVAGGIVLGVASFWLGRKLIAARYDTFREPQET